uniref:Glycoprotein n=1 Tax=human metapneumovirus TaxID=162145 RepID=I3QBI3_9MONO|nr:glycoprotein [Human metapneumovirus]AFI56759.1 glycoprotein [Human metapneumovirus]
MEVRVENIRAIDMFKAKIKNRIRSSRCYRNATLILIGLTALSMALNIFLIIDHATLKNMIKTENCANMPSAEPSKKTPMTSTAGPNTKPNPQQATQWTTENSTSPAVTSEGHLYTGTTQTPDTTAPQQTTDKHTTPQKSTNEQITQTTTEKKTTRATTQKEKKGKENTNQTTSTAATQTTNTTNQIRNASETTTTSDRPRTDTTTQSSEQTTRATDPSSLPHYAQRGAKLK